MKTFALATLIVSSTLAFSQAAPSPSQQPTPTPSAQTPTTASLATGKWKLHATIAGQDSDSECTFKVSDNKLTGTCASADTKPSDITGTVDGKKVTWIQKGDYQGTALTITYVGTIDGDKITGGETVDPFGVDGDFTATRVA